MAKHEKAVGVIGDSGKALICSVAINRNEEEGNLVVVVIDTNPSAELIKDGECIMGKCLDALITFCNSHLMMDSSNKLAVIGCHTDKSAYLYPDAKGQTSEQAPTDGQYELFADVKNAIEKNIKKLILNSPLSPVYMESLMAGAMSMALCYIHRIRKQQIGPKKMPARIFVFSASGDCAAQYMTFMNVFFTAQKENETDICVIASNFQPQARIIYNVYIDACVIEKDSGMLQQGCDVTGGTYLKVENTATLLEYILWVFLPSIETRKQMILPPRIHVDYRAACFCHRNLIEIGYVCSVCLSIFCNFSPICSTCQTTFKLGPIPTIITKKKKKSYSNYMNSS